MKKLIILGKGPGWSECPKPTLEVPVWSMTNILSKYRDVSMVFEIHDLREKLGRREEGYIHQEAISEAIRLKIPYMVREHWDFLPHLAQHIYPYKEVTEYFGIDFFGCSMDAMLALAVYQGYEEIHLHGTGQHRGSTWDYQIESINFWLGVCFGKGIKLHIHHWGGVRHTDLLSTHDGLVYGFGGKQRRFDYTNSVESCTCCKMPHNPMCETYAEYVYLGG